MSKNLKQNFSPLTKTEEGIYIACLNETDAYNLSNYLLLDNDIDLFIPIIAIDAIVFLYIEAGYYLVTSLGDKLSAFWETLRAH